MKTKTILLGVMVAGAMAASIFMAYKAQSAEPVPVPRKAAQENTPAVDWLDMSKMDDSRTGRAALSLDYAKGDNPDPISMTVYSPDGGVLATLYPDGTVKVQKGTPEQAARVFYAVITKQLRTCGKIP